MKAFQNVLIGDGDRTIRNMRATLFLQDSSSRDISESEFSAINGDLKPNYSAKFFTSLDYLPKAWAEGKITVKIRTIEFAD